MDNQKTSNSGLNLNTKSFLTAIVILFALMIISYLLTFTIPAGEYDRALIDGQEMIVNNSFTYTEGGLPLIKWLLSPLLVLTADGNITVIAIILFLLVIGGTFYSLDQSGLMNYLLKKICHRFQSKKYLLLSLVSLFFMSMGAFIGSFEECVPLVPLAVALSVSLGWDAYIGMGMSLLAVGCGFSSGVCNPFTVGVAQELLGLPMFSGMGLRFISFLLIYGLLLLFLVRHAKKLDSSQKPVPGEAASPSTEFTANSDLNRGIMVFVSVLGAGIATILSSTFIPALQDILVPFVAVIFLAAGVSSCLAAKMPGRQLAKNFFAGVTTIFPAVLLILMASSINYILTEAKILDTILHYLTGQISRLPGNIAILFVYLCALLMDFFISSGSAKAFLLMPLIGPLSELCGFSSQLAVTAYAFGDGFSNLFYCTNPVLLISLGLSGISYGKWLKWTWPFMIAVLLLTSVILLIGG